MRLEITALTKSFGKQTVFDAIHAQFDTGQYLLHGSNGIGKSTLFDILAGVDLHYRGQVTLHNTAHMIDARANHIEYLQRVSFAPDRLDFFQHIELAHAINFIRKQRQNLDPMRLDELIALFGIEKYFHHQLGNLSLGNQKKFMLSIALAIQADVYLFDEPLNGLDAEGKVNFLRNLPKHPSIQVMASHRSHDYDAIDYQPVDFVSLNNN